MNNQSEQNYQFEHKYQQSIWRKVFTFKWKKKQTLAINLNREISNHFGQKQQPSISNRDANNQSEQTYQQPIWTKLYTSNFRKQLVRINLDRNIKNQFWTEISTIDSNKNINKHFWTNKRTFSLKIWTVFLNRKVNLKKIWTSNLNRNMNNHFG